MVIETIKISYTDSFEMNQGKFDDEFKNPMFESLIKKLCIIFRVGFSSVWVLDGVKERSICAQKKHIIYVYL